MKRAAALVFLAYVLAVAAGGTAIVLLERGPIVELLVADVLATCVVFAFSVAYDNSSFYDAYWSVAPPLIAIAWLGPEIPARAVLVLLLIGVWAVRLTYNWARGWQGLGHEDWRYVDIRGKSGKLYWAASFAGIHMFPTLIVFLACLPLLPALRAATPLNLIDAAAVLVTAGAIVIEAVADVQLHRFCASKSSGAIMDRGLWAYSRHPNYFGEASFWWGLALFAVATTEVRYWHLLGAAAITCMFVFASIPLMEKRSVARRPAYAEHQRRVSMLVPWFPRRI